MTVRPEFLDKPLPASQESERIVLGACFLDESHFASVGGLNPSHFYSANHRIGFRAMQNLSVKNESISPITVFEEIKILDPLNSLTSSEIVNWTYGLPQFSSLDSYIGILKDKAVKRAVIHHCSDLAAKTLAEEDLGAELAGFAVNTFQDIYSQSLDKQKPTVVLSEGLTSNYERWEKMLRKEIVTIETGLPNVDNRLTGGGLEKGMFHVIGARPTKGKTSLGLDIAAHNAIQGKTVVFFTLELSRDVLLDRFISPLAGIERWKITSEWMNQTDFQRLVRVSEYVGHLNLHINHKARIAKDMRLALKEVARSTGGQIDLIIVDFLTKMSGTKQSKYESVSYNANALAEFASEFNAAVVCLAQLSRDIEKRRAETETNKDRNKPRLSDFRDSGEIEELGRTIFALWGEDETNGLRDVDFSCLKQGEGQTFDEKLIFNTNFMTFGARKNIVQGN